MPDGERELHELFLHQLLFDLSFNSNCFSILYGMFSCFLYRTSLGEKKSFEILKQQKNYYLHKQNHKRQGNSVICLSYRLCPIQEISCCFGKRPLQDWCIWVWPIAQEPSIICPIQEETSSICAVYRTSAVQDWTQSRKCLIQDMSIL